MIEIRTPDLCHHTYGIEYYGDFERACIFQDWMMINVFGGEKEKALKPFFQGGFNAREPWRYVEFFGCGPEIHEMILKIVDDLCECLGCDFDIQ
jgi:hypothetical protein